MVAPPKTWSFYFFILADTAIIVIVGNKAKRQILERVFLKTYLCLSGVKKCSLFGKFDVLFSCNTRFENSPFCLITDVMSPMPTIIRSKLPGQSQISLKLLLISDFFFLINMVAYPTKVSIKQCTRNYSFQEPQPFLHCCKKLTRYGNATLCKRKLRHDGR